MEPTPATAPDDDSDEWGWSFDPRHSLAARAALAVGCGAVIFTLLLCWIAGSLLRRQLEAPLGASLETLAFQFVDKLDRVTYERFNELQSVARLTAMRSAAMPPAERSRVLETLLAGSRDYAWIGFVDADGNILNGTRGFLEEKESNVGSRLWFQSARKQFFAGDVGEWPELAREVDLGASEPPRYVALATPVAKPNGQLLGVLVAQIRWSWARDVLASVMTDTARRDRVGLTMYAANGDALLDSGKFGWTEPPPMTALAEHLQTRGYFWETVSGDTEYLTGFARSRGFRDFRGFGGVVAVRQPTAVVLAPVAALRRAILGWGAVFAVAAAAVAGFFAARLTRRLRAVGVAADRIRLGDVLSLMPRQRGDAELARMCGALDEMVKGFREKQEQLDPEKAHPVILPEPVVKNRDVSRYV